MAIINPAPVDGAKVSGVATYSWETLTENDTASRLELAGTLPAIASFQVVGTFGGATVVLQGSNDGTNWVTMKDTAGNDVSLTATGSAEVSSAMRYFRPSASGGSSQDVDVFFVARG